MWRVSDLETYLTQVWSPDVRPLVGEAWRCYNAGAIRASVAATWTAVTADIITKLVRLADEGDDQAVPFRDKIVEARDLGISREGVKAMQTIEDSLLAEARTFELIDSIEERELGRIKQDRHLCVHPSLREQGDAYEPRPEVARGHLAVALTTLLIHPPTQGRNIITEFGKYISDPSFVSAPAHIQAAFYDRVKTAARKSIVAVAAKHALLETSVPPDVTVDAEEIADRMAIALAAFADRDRVLVRQTMANVSTKFHFCGGGTQLRAITRLGQWDFFWDMVDPALNARLTELVNDLETYEGQLLPDSLAVLALVGQTTARQNLPALETRYRNATMGEQIWIASQHPDPYFVPVALRLLESTASWRRSEMVGQLLVQHSQYLTLDDLQDALSKWVANDECRRASGMRQIAVELLHTTAHLGTARVQLFEDFIAAARAVEEADSVFRYVELSTAIASLS